MDRKKFLKNGLMGMGAIVAIPTLIASCSNSNTEIPSDTETGDCNLSPRETAGPFPIKTPSNLVRENIIGDRSGFYGIVMPMENTQNMAVRGCKVQTTLMLIF